jgi:hypothetical protein
MPEAGLIYPGMIVVATIRIPPPTARSARRHGVGATDMACI